MPHQVKRTSPWSQYNLAALKGGLLCRGYFDIHDGPPAGHKRRRNGNHQRFRRLVRFRGHVAERFGPHERHAANVTVARLILDDFGMHRTDPLAHERGVQHTAACRHARTDHRSHKHLWFQPPVFVGHVDSHLYRPRVLVQDRINECNPARKSLARIGFRRELDRLPVTQPLQVRFIGVQLHPHLSQVSDGVDAIAGSHAVTFLPHLLDDDAGNRRVDSDVISGRAALFDFLDLDRCQAEQPQLFAGGLRKVNWLDERRGGRSGPPVLEGFNQFRLCRIQLFAVDVDQVVALFDLDPRVIDVQSVEPAGNPRGDVR